MSVTNTDPRASGVDAVKPSQGAGELRLQPNHGSPSIAPYLPEIDVLRALAVLFVVAAHLNLKYMSGGYVGVDIFFVISGFVITRMIHVELASGRFSFVAFYERRVRRIIPALYVVVLATAIAALFVVLPAEYESFGKSELSVVTFTSNILFWQESGYFAGPAYEKPLLHTWSLGVEEQFYLLFPIVIVFLAKWTPARGVLWLGVLAAASFGLNVWGVYHHPEAAFYLAPGRAWEFLLGSLLAVAPLPPLRHAPQRPAFITVGLVLIFAPIFLFTEHTPFPGAAALLPCVGAALFIWLHSGWDNPSIKLPIAQIPIFFGQISYSLYLWHWPIIMLYRNFLGTSPEFTRFTSLQKLVLFTAMVIVAYASFRLIEQPIRRRSIFPTRATLFAATGAVSGVIAALGGTSVIFRGFPGRVDPQVAAIANYLHYEPGPLYGHRTCFLDVAQDESDLKSECTSIEPRKRNIIIWGDSVAAHYVYGFQAIAEGAGVHILQATMSSCPPVLAFAPSNNPNCEAFNRGVRSIIEERRPDAVVISGYWNGLRDSVGRAGLVSYLRATLEDLAATGIPVFVLGPSIQYKDSLPYLLAHFATSDLGRFDARKYLNKDIFEVDAQIKAGIAGIPGVTFVSILDNICERDLCPLFANGVVPMQWDYLHLTADGSVFVVRKLAPFILPKIHSRSPD